VVSHRRTLYRTLARSERPLIFALQNARARNRIFKCRIGGKKSSTLRHRTYLLRASWPGEQTHARRHRIYRRHLYAARKYAHHHTPCINISAPRHHVYGARIAHRALRRRGTLRLTGINSAWHKPRARAHNIVTLSKAWRQWHNMRKYAALRQHNGCLSHAACGRSFFSRSAIFAAA